jgi:hypothetical protein
MVKYMSNVFKEEIIKVIIRKDGKLNSAVLRQQWFLDSELGRYIFDNTQFLPETSTLSERIWCILNDITERPVCCYCGSPVVFLRHYGAGYIKTCNSRKCINTSPEVIEKHKKTMLHRYGALISEKTRTKLLSRVNSFIQKSKETILDRYGVEYLCQIPDHQIKCKATRENKITSKSFLEKRRLTKIQLFNNRCKSFGNVLDINMDKHDKNLYDILFSCNTCNTDSIVNSSTLIWRTNDNINPCANCNPINANESFAQRAIYEYIQQIYNGEIIYNDRSVLTNKELDIYLPELCLAFEYDGVYWHSFNEIETIEQQNNHLNKTILCNNNGINLIHIFETEWLTKKEIVKSRLGSLLGINNRIPARKCSVIELTNHQANQFLKRTHIQSHKTGTCNIGLLYNNKLVCCMTIGKSRYRKNIEWEILRYSSELNTNIIGGASKLFKYFIKQYHPTSVISYTDNRWGTSKLYKNLGFELIGNSKPSYFYYNKADGGMVLHNRIKFQKHKLKHRLKIFDNTKTEAQNMFDNGYRRIWDCGNSIWIYKNN